MINHFEFNEAQFLVCSKRQLFNSIQAGIWNCHLHIKWLFYNINHEQLTINVLAQILEKLETMITKFSLRFEIIADKGIIYCEIKPIVKLVTKTHFNNNIGLSSKLKHLFFTFDTDCNFAVQLLHWYHNYPIENPLWFLFLNVHLNYSPALIFTCIHDNYKLSVGTIQEINPFFYIIILVLTLHEYSFVNILELFPFTDFTRKCFYIYFLYLKKYLFNTSIHFDSFYSWLDEYPLLAILLDATTTKKNNLTDVQYLLLKRTNTLIKRLSVYTGDIVNTIVNFVDTF